MGRGRFGCQVQNLLFTCISSLVRGHKLISQNGDPLGCFDRFTVGGRQKCSFLPSHPMCLDSVGPHHYGSRLRLSHLLPKFCLLGHIPS
jgi:hypothetical protein